MKKLLSLMLCIILVFMFGCAAEPKDSGKMSDPSGNDKPAQTPPADDNTQQSSNQLQDPSEDKAKDKTYTVDVIVSESKLQEVNAWMDSLGGIPGYTAECVYSKEYDCYNLVSEGMGAWEAIEKIEISSSCIKIIFRENVKMHRWMESIGGLIMVNSYITTETASDGTEYTVIHHKYDFSANRPLTTENGRYVEVFPLQLEDGDSVVDFFISSGKVD